MGPEPTHLQLQNLVSAFAPGAELRGVRTLIGGISARSLLLEVDEEGAPARYVTRQPGEWSVSQDPQAAVTQFNILRLVEPLAVPSPAPVFLDASGQYLGTRGFVMRYIDGAPTYAPDNLDDYLVQAAKALVAVHQCKVAPDDLAKLPDQRARLRHAIEWFPQDLDESLNEGPLREAIRSFWPLPECETPRLLHGDFWPGNLLWKDGQLVGLADWEECERGDPLNDLAITRLEMIWTFGGDAIERFTDVYAAETGADLSALPKWDLIVALRPLHCLNKWAEGWPEMGRPDITHATMRAAHHAFVSAAMAAL